MRLGRQRLVLLLLGAAASSAAVFGWQAYSRLTPIEEKLVGRWYLLAKDEDLGEKLLLIEYGRDRKVRYIMHQWSAGSMTRLASVAGHWRVEGETLVVDFGPQYVARAAQKLDPHSDVLLFMNGRYVIRSADDGALEFQHGSHTFRHERFPGNLPVSAEALGPIRTDGESAILRVCLLGSGGLLLLVLLFVVGLLMTRSKA